MPFPPSSEYSPTFLEMSRLEAKKDIHLFISDIWKAEVPSPTYTMYFE